MFGRLIKTFFYHSKGLFGRLFLFCFFVFFFAAHQCRLNAFQQVIHPWCKSLLKCTTGGVSACKWTFPHFSLLPLLSILVAAPARKKPTPDKKAESTQNLITRLFSVISVGNDVVLSFDQTSSCSCHFCWLNIMIIIISIGSAFRPLHIKSLKIGLELNPKWPKFFSGTLREGLPELVCYGSLINFLQKSISPVPSSACNEGQQQ